MSKTPTYDEYDPWATYDPSPRYVRRTPARVRNRKPTLASVMRQVRNAGIDVARYEVDDGKIIVVITGTTSGIDSSIEETSADIRKLL